MSKSFNEYSPITEMTLNAINDMELYSINHCDVLKYFAGFGHGFSCLKPSMKCIDYKDLNKK